MQGVTRRRAKPLLGTLVELSVAWGLGTHEAKEAEEAEFVRATDAAWACLQAAHQAMSFHEAGSDVRAIARAAKGQVLRVADATWRTLALALEIELASGGVFNAAMAPVLVERGLLPHPEGAQVPLAHSLAEGLALEDDGEGERAVRILQPLWIDLGGIAKGLAVDDAVSALQACGVPSGCVNAGGDLRVFGQASQRVSVRLPQSPTQVLSLADIQDMACASSGAYFLAGPAEHSAMVGVRDAALPAPPASVSVLAASCAVADALTKVVWLQGARAAPLLARLQACAMVIDTQGRITHMGSGLDVGCSHA